MKRFVSPLVWLCLISAVALNALALADPTGIYADYRGKLPQGRPPIAAVFTAAEDGLYPWSEPPAPPAEKAPAAEPPVPPEIAPQEEAVPAAEPPAPSVAPPAFITVDPSYFDDALFLGNSFIEGFSLFAQVPDATYYFQRGLTVWTVLDKSFLTGPQGRQTLSQALAQQHFGKIYVQLGINELGDKTPEAFAAQYAVVVDALRAMQPDAVIYILAIFHTTQEKSEISRFKNETINECNAAIAQLADGTRVFFVDANPLFDDDTGALPAELSGDGVHLQAPYYVSWRDYLCRFGLAAQA